MSEAQTDEAAGDLLAAAHSYAAAGLAVFPCKPGLKVPATADGLKAATTDVEQVSDWWKRWPGANIGVRTGRESGIVALDVDTPKGGAGTLAELERKHGKLPVTARVLTGGGGEHIYFRHPGSELRNSAGHLGVGLDVRGDGGYVVAPPSVHESGRTYQWKRGLDRGIADLPGWLLEGEHERRNGSAPAVGGEIPKGERDATLASLAGSMRRRGMGEAEILAALTVANSERCRPPLPESDIQRIARSIAGYPPAEPPTTTPVEPFTLEVIAARDLCAQPDPEGSGELLGPFVVEGYRTLIGGHTGEGKTTLALSVLAAILDGRELLGFTGRGGVRALFLDAEQGAKSLKRRLREAGLHQSDRLDVIRAPDGLCLDADPRHVAELDRILRAGGYGLVVADPLYKLHTGDSNAEREAVDLMRRFDAWRDELGFALVLPIHCRKPIPGSKFTIHDLFGSSAYVRGAEVVLGLQRLRDGYSRLHFLKDRDGDLPVGDKWGLLFDREEGFRRDPDDGQPRQTAAERVQEILESDPEGLTQEQLREITGYAEKTVRAALKQIGAKKLTRPGPHGKPLWVLSPDEQLWPDDEQDIAA